MADNISLQPIDLVIPMVFPQDRQWQEAYARSSGIDATSNVRFRSWGTEELLIRCCMKHMPWLRRIHLLLASESQVQPWMRQCSMSNVQCSIVFHRDFIPSHLLPCFNVNTIEMHLHRIPGIAEQFIYSNDDLFPLSALSGSDFFRDGLPCQHHNECPYPASPNLFQRFVKNGLDMVAADFGRKFPRTWLDGGHSMQPMLRSTVEKVCTIHADRISQSFTFKRTDKNFNQYIFPFYQHLSGAYVDYVPARRYLQPNTPIENVKAVIRDPDAGIVCINDHESIPDWENRAAIVRREIRERLNGAE